MFLETGSLGADLVDGESGGLLTLSGQDHEWWTGLRRAIAGRPDVETWCRATLRALAQRLDARPDLSPTLALGTEPPTAWLDVASSGDEDGTVGDSTPPDWTTSAPARLAGTALAHLAAVRALLPAGLDAGTGLTVATGHSSGLLAAWAFARRGADLSPADAVDVLLALAITGEEVAAHRWSLPPATSRADDAAAPMVAVSGLTEPALRSLLPEGSDTAPAIALQNAWDRFVLSGRPADLAAWRRTAGGEVRAESLTSPVAFHHPALRAATDRALERLTAAGIRLEGELRVPLIDPADGVAVTGGDATERLIRSLCTRPVRWADTLATVVADAVAEDGRPPVVIDPGPSTVTARMTARSLRGTGTTVLALGDAADVRALSLAAERPAPALDYDEFRPRIRTTAEGRTQLHTRHTSWTGRSPMVLAGMTPTTVDMAIVAAAAEGGHVAELAGGGQVSAAIFSERLEELAERLSPGHEVVFNALHLDPYLWGLHLGRDRLVQKARREGAPICGVTVSAGMPDRDDAVRLLDELVADGMWLNAFKPGDEAGVRKVLAIADATPHRVWLHLEGGLAGGHHAWSDLEQVLVATYDEIRRRPNVALLVGGGIGTPERSTALLDGTWSLAHTRVRMPVDGVLVGTAAMATAESTASPSVKDALVAARGADGPVARGVVDGGVTSGRSGLGADIHYLDTHAARVAAMLEEVAGAAARVAERHDEIAEALAGTAKPWFGDLGEMTYSAALERFVELTALGRNGRYEDGRWLDPTHRRLFLDLLRRWEARCCDVDEGRVESLFADLDDDPEELDDPEKAIERFVRAHPIAAVTELEPSDAAHLVALCDRPGKPVPFVVAIDAEVRRRYLADSLWQAHSDLWDAEQVLVIPGPTAVAGITQADEPVADLLDRFGAAALASVRDAGADEVALRSAVETLIELPTVVSRGASVPSPIRRMAEGATWSIDRGEGAVTARAVLGATGGDGAGEELVLRGLDGPVGGVEVELRWAALPGLAGDGRLSFVVEVDERAGVPVATIDGASLDAAQRDLMAVVIDAATTARDRREPASGASEDRLGSAPVPDAAMGRVWPDVFRALSEVGAAEGMVRLVHARHRVRRAEPGTDGPVVATSRPTPSGRELRTVAHAADRCFDDVFLVRRAPGEPAEIAPHGAAIDEVLDVAADAPARVATPRLELVTARRTAPTRSDAFALLSGDANPLHRSDLVARLAGLRRRIVHGMWTSAAAQEVVVDEVLGGRGDRLVDWEVRFLDVVEPGEDVTVTVTRIGVRQGRRILEVDVRCGDRPVAIAEAVVAPARTAYVFPGQGIQHRGMGRATRDRSEAARAVWERAERYCRAELGFSLLDVVDGNPTEIEVALGDGLSVLHRHPEGVLHLTQFTQVSMATLAASQVAELQEVGAFDPDAVLAGHSVGEYNALAAVGGVLPLEAVLGVVWARGSAMHTLVPRDADGASGYRLAVVRPHLAGLDANEAVELVDAVAADTGELCEVVNHNLKGRQYAVAGTTAALAVLQERLGNGTAPGRAPYLEVPGIDVPFHSRALAPGVAEFRDHLDRALPEEIDPARLVGRYVPNLYPVTFRLDRDYVEGIAAACDGAACTEVLADWDRLAERPARLARQVLVELLAWQFASPVRWIETTDVLLAGPHDGGLGVERVVEVGVGASPTLANLTKAAVAAEGHGAQVLHVEIDELEVMERTEPPAPVDEVDDAEAVAGEGAAAPAPVAAPAAAAAGPAAEDAPVGLADAVPALLAMSAGLRLDQLGDDTVEQLVDGASSRRNQVLMDLGKELGIGAVDGAHELPLSELVTRLEEPVRGHRHPGPVLTTMIDTAVSAAAGRCGSAPGRLADRVRNTWGLGEGWVERCRLEIALGTRDGVSRRGGDLATLDAGDADALVDGALAAAAARLGVTLTMPTASTAAGIDGAAVESVVRGVADAVTEAAAAARAALGAATRIDLPEETIDADAGTERSAALRLADLEAEHGAGRAEEVRSIFDESRVQLLSSGLVWARADLDRLVHDPPTDPCERAALVTRLSRFAGTDDRFDETVEWYLSGRHRAGWSPGLDDELRRIRRGRDASDAALDVDGLTVLVSGASPRSIGEQVVATLIGSGATVVALTSSLDPARRLAWRELERRHAGPGARLFVAPVNLASFRDVDAVVDWLERAPSPDVAHPGRPDVVVPFAAPAVLGDAADAGPRQEVELRVMLLGVERLVARCAEHVRERAERVGAADAGVLTAVLPMSPNHGMFGGDGAYGHAKAGLEVLATRRAAESRRWGGWCRTVGVEIGWVRGTGLMGGHDDLAPVVEDRLGITTHDVVDVGRRIAELCVPNGHGGPGDERVNLTGGLDSIDPQALADLVRSAGVTSTDGPLGDDAGGSGAEDDATVTILALPRPRGAGALGGDPCTALLDDDLLDEGGLDEGDDGPDGSSQDLIALEDMVVLCGIAEIGPWGTSATRADAERHRELPARAVLELAVRCGLLEWSASGSAGAWVDVESGEEVPEEEVADRYRDEVGARCGIRHAEQTIEGELRVFTERPVVVAVGSASDAQALVGATPGAAAACVDGTWKVTIPAGAALWASHQVPLPRAVTAPIAEGMDPTAFGVPTEMASAVDPIAAWNLATTAEAFRDAGTDPEELLGTVAAARVACTQGTGMGGMDSIRTIHLAPRRRTPHSNDVLQEALGNVPPAHAVQSFVGGSGPMIHPVAACATAGVSLELALDLVRGGKADVVVGGGFDDLGPEGIVGFAEMSATADDARLAAAGFSPREMSRPGDRSRAGFVESQGGGSFLVCRGSVAAELGLPVRAVVVFSSSHGDGLQTSIPAPGPGALGSVEGGSSSPLGRALAAHGLRADDIGVVSKHDTSTRANDPNEARIHERIQRELGRSPGNPLRVVSQKSLTGHAKGGSALWQIAGLCDVFDDGVVPGNPNLDAVDPEVQPGPSLVVDDRPLRLRRPPRAALLTSLGFGHVSVVAALAHPDVFTEALLAQRGRAAALNHAASAARRRRERDRLRRRSLYGQEPAFRRRTPA
jgi:fatty acid synthase